MLSNTAHNRDILSLYLTDYKQEVKSIEENKSNTQVFEASSKMMLDTKQVPPFQLIPLLNSHWCSFSFLPAPPSVKLKPQVVTVPVGAWVTLECQVSGHPLPSIRWVKRGHSKQTGGKISLGWVIFTVL